MGFLSDASLEKILTDDINATDRTKLVISPYSESSLTPVGYDLRVGGRYASSSSPNRVSIQSGEKVIIPPHSTILIETLEMVRMPLDRTLGGLIESKVSLVSRGLSHISTTLDPDWTGHLLIAVHNHSSRTHRLDHGQPFCTAVFLRSEDPAKRDCDKQPDREDVLLKLFEEEAKKRSRRRIMRAYLPPAIIAVFGVCGYAIFGPNGGGFPAMVAAGVAVAQLLAGRSQE